MMTWGAPQVIGTLTIPHIGTVMPNNIHDSTKQYQPLNSHRKRLGVRIDTALPPGPAPTPDDLSRGPSELASLSLECEALKAERHRVDLQYAFEQALNPQKARGKARTISYEKDLLLVAIGALVKRSGRTAAMIADRIQQAGLAIAVDRRTVGNKLKEIPEARERLKTGRTDVSLKRRERNTLQSILHTLLLMACKGSFGIDITDPLSVTQRLAQWILGEDGLHIDQDFLAVHLEEIREAELERPKQQTKKQTRTL